jgi:hypothetical protein
MLNIEHLVLLDTESPVFMTQMHYKHLHSAIIDESDCLRNHELPKSG